MSGLCEESAARARKDQDSGLRREPFLLLINSQSIMWKSCSVGIDRGYRVSVLCDSETKSVFVHKYLWCVCVCVYDFFYVSLTVCVACTRHFSPLD